MNIGVEKIEAIKYVFKSFSRFFANLAWKVSKQCVYDLKTSSQNFIFDFETGEKKMEKLLNT